MQGLKISYLAMACVVIASNYLVLFPINDWLTWGAFTYPVSFLVTELTNRQFGPQKARRAVYFGFLLAVILSVWLATPKIALASGTAFLCAQLLDILVFNRLLGGVWWYAPFFASVLASLLDGVLFWGIAFWGEDLPVVTWGIGDTLVKLAMDVGMLTPFRYIIGRLSRTEILTVS